MRQPADTQGVQADAACALVSSCVCPPAGMQHAAATARMLEEILAGCTSPDPAQHGMTTEEERAASNVQWPGCLDAVKPPNAGLRLFGGAAFERCLNEFQVAASQLTFPTCERHWGCERVAAVGMDATRLQGQLHTRAHLTCFARCCSPHTPLGLQPLSRATGSQTYCLPTRCVVSCRDLHVALASTRMPCHRACAACLFSRPPTLSPPPLAHTGQEPPGRCSARCRGHRPPDGTRAAEPAAGRRVRAPGVHPAARAGPGGRQVPQAR